MSKIIRFALLLLLCSVLFLGVGCSNEHAEPVASSESNVSRASKASESSKVLLLPVPREISLSPGLAAAYEEALEQHEATDQQLNIALLSQQIAGETLQLDPELSHRFFVQSGRRLTRAFESGLEEFPDESAGYIFFNQALGHAHAGEDEEALAALNAAVGRGFSKVHQIEYANEFKATRNLDGFEELLAGVKVNFAKQIVLEAERDLAGQDSFTLELDAVDIKGQPLKLTEFVGKVAIVDLWGTWCPPCREEIPSFIKLQNKYGDQGFQMIGINFEHGSEAENLALVQEFVVENGVNYPCTLGGDEIRSQVPNLRSFPTTLFVDKSGTVRAMAVGHRPYEYLERMVQLLLDEPYEAPK